MQQYLSLFLQIITTDFFIGYGMYTLLFLITTGLVKKPWLKKIDENANQFIAFVGMVYIIAWITALFVFYQHNPAKEQEQMLNRMFGQYWFGFWLQPLLWFGVTQLLRSEKVGRNVLLRIFISLILIVSVERFVMLVITFHRDYLPSSWTMYNEAEIFPDNLALGILFKIVLFVALTGIYYILKIRFTELIYGNPINRRVRP